MERQHFPLLDYLRSGLVDLPTAQVRESREQCERKDFDNRARIPFLALRRSRHRVHQKSSFRILLESIIDCIKLLPIVGADGVEKMEPGTDTEPILLVIVVGGVGVDEGRGVCDEVSI